MIKPDFAKGNGLIPAIVQDVESKQVLMLAYVNEEAYQKMLETKQTCFYSRSRQQLWHKGETSGHFQHIVGMYLDCDNDTFLIIVRQDGAACHTGSYSCFFKTIVPYDLADLNDRLYDVLEDQEIHLSKVEEGLKKKADAHDEAALEDLYFDLIAKLKAEGVDLRDFEAKMKAKYPLKGQVKKIFYE